MSVDNPLWGAPRIHGELLKLGIDISERTVSRYLPKRQKPPSQTWQTFLANHIADLIAIDFFTVPTIRCRVLFCFLVLAHHRRRVVYFNVTEHPTTEWTAQQLVDALPWDTAPRFLLRDRDRIYGGEFRQRMAGFEMTEVLTAAGAPWQNPYVERLIGSIRRECLDHVIVRSARHLRHLLSDYFAYYHRTRTHLSLGKDAPGFRCAQAIADGPIIELPAVGGLHHRYERRAA